MAVAAVQGISVVARFRPLNSLERSSSSKERLCAEFDDEHASIVRYTSETSSNTFAFDRVFSPASTQREVYEQSTARNLVAECFEGYNATVLAYGQTGSGKTWTMMGGDSADAEGLIPRLARMVLEKTAALYPAESGWTSSVQGTFVEIYNNKLADLFSDEDADSQSPAVSIVHDSKSRPYLRNVTYTTFTSNEDVVRQMGVASLRRRTASTDCNEQSSRSHAIFTIYIHAENAERSKRVEGKLHLVDLAGSERAKRTNATGERLQEGAAINKSLSHLATVFGRLRAAKGRAQTHIPYRDMKLTHVLQECFSKDGKTMMLVNGASSFCVCRRCVREKEKGHRTQPCSPVHTANHTLPIASSSSPPAQ